MSDSARPDELLVELIRKGDAFAFKELYHRYYSQLFRYGYYHLFSVEITKDLIQDLFARVWYSRTNLNPRKSIKAYLYKSLTNLIINHVKLKSSQNIPFDSFCEETSVNDSDINVDLDIQTALNKLPEKLKTVFVLSRIEGYKYKEIAEILGISVKGVEKRMSKAFTLLRTIFE